MKLIGHYDLRLRFFGVEVHPGATWSEIDSEVVDEIHRAERVLNEYGFKLSFDLNERALRGPVITNFEVQVSRQDWEEHPEIREACR